jgi:hypothetical protein
VPADKIGDEITSNAVGGVFPFSDDSGQEGLCGRVPFKIDSAADFGVGAVQLCPARASARGLLAHDGEIVFFEACVAGDRLPQAAAAIAGYLDDALHIFTTKILTCDWTD